MSALYMSMSAQETDLEIEDELAKGLFSIKPGNRLLLLTIHSAKDITGPQVQNFITIEEEFRAREGRAISRLSNRSADPKSHGTGGAE